MNLDIFMDEHEREQHEEAINQICRQFPEQQEFIRQSYLEKLTPLSSEAQIRTYLPIIVSRQVFALLEKHLQLSASSPHLAGFSPIANTNLT